MIAGVFVYGTLKPGGSNHHLAVKAGLLGAQQDDVSGFRLYHLEPEGYPAMRRGNGRVYGYLLTFKNLAAVLAILDALEGCDLRPPLYERVQVQLDSGLTAWTYLYACKARLEGEGAYLLETGHWNAEQVSNLK